VIAARLLLRESKIENRFVGIAPKEWLAGESRGDRSPIPGSSRLRLFDSGQEHSSRTSLVRGTNVPRHFLSIPMLRAPVELSALAKGSLPTIVGLSMRNP
jgi:hypothetical protein